jgi:hypothetical protein
MMVAAQVVQDLEGTMAIVYTLLEEEVPQGIPALVALADMLLAVLVAIIVPQLQGQVAVVAEEEPHCLYMAVRVPFMRLGVVVWDYWGKIIMVPQA